MKHRRERTNTQIDESDYEMLYYDLTIGTREKIGIVAVAAIIIIVVIDFLFSIFDRL